MSLNLTISAAASAPGGGVGFASRPLDDPRVFRRALLHALRNLHRRDVLAKSPLCDAPFVRACSRGGDSMAMRLRTALVDAIARLAASPGDRYPASLLEVAFISVPRRKQLAVACDLGLGFSTYRRHLSAAVDVLLDALTPERSSLARR
jgi:hypothetical protein